MANRGETHSPASQSEHARRMLQDWYYAPRDNEPGDTQTSAPFPHDIIRVKLTADWYDCEDGTGTVLTLDDKGKPKDAGWTVTLRDPLGIKNGCATVRRPGRLHACRNLSLGHRHL